MFYLNSTLNFGIPSVLIFLLEGYYKEDRLLACQTAQQKGTTARNLYSNKISQLIHRRSYSKSRYAIASKIKKIFLCASSMDIY